MKWGDPPGLSSPKCHTSVPVGGRPGQGGAGGEGERPGVHRAETGAGEAGRASLRGPEGARPWDTLLLDFRPPDQENSFLLSSAPQCKVGSPWELLQLGGRTLWAQQSASTVSGSPTMSLCTSLKASMNRSIQSCRSPPVANLARSAV